MQIKSPHRNILEYAVIITVVLVVAFLVGANIYYQRIDTRQRAMYYELQMIRSGINLFKVVEKRNPKNLVELAKGIYRFPGDEETRKYLTNVPFNEGGELVDPFGNEFIYDYKTGWVRSSTSGYEMW